VLENGKALENGSRWRMVVAGEWQVLENALVGPPIAWARALAWREWSWGEFGVSRSSSQAGQASTRDLNPHLR
jgi:hypothetical protein